MMKTVMFQIRIADEFQKLDEAVISKFTRSRSISKINTELVKSDVNYWSVLIFYTENPNYKEDEAEVKYRRYLENIENEIPINQNLNLIKQPSEEEMYIYNELKNWRIHKSKETDLQVYNILKNSELMSIARQLPLTIEELKIVNGLDQLKIQLYGIEIIEFLKRI